MEDAENKSFASKLKKLSNAKKELEFQALLKRLESVTRSEYLSYITDCQEFENNKSLDYITKRLKEEGFEVTIKNEQKPYLGVVKRIHISWENAD